VRDHRSPDTDRVVQEVTQCFHEYEAALVARDLDALDRWFWNDPKVIRFGISEIQYGAEAIAAWRRIAPHVGDDRALRNVHVLPLGDDVAVVTTEFRDGSGSTVGRQSQVWAREGRRWRVVHAHVSVVDAADCEITGRPPAR
jgi:ketosteroid isomerase-like protein